MALTDTGLTDLAERLLTVPGVVGVVLGGSRARGTHTEESDTDLGVYYRAPLDTEALGKLAEEVAGPGAGVTRTGGWGPWVDGGGWLRIDGHPVDWIYRDVDRVRRCWADAEQGRYAFHMQAGHPLGVPDFSYPGELALSRVLADPSGELAALRRRVEILPRPLAEALVAGLWEADFLLGLARKAVSRGDSAYVAGCLFRVAGVCAHALHGAAGRWLISEKGAVAAAAALPGAPERFQSRMDSVFAAVDGDPVHLTTAIDLVADLVLETADACAMMLR
ncbi:nucleotidyltransferase domain-containing protein [Actinoplanes sp. NEAU-A12]|uniref:Nucleotidyltransferase domain-containing protein n=1 Tax=Actinoplanes sandaracinus TaxID=3045177 RepID=A0ABT6WJ56_9ACTN|nr:nucleotidyltransferase domain-containing protein [Actinoplanes sandaracinus]MDI6099695.1 nucleotidyltransferase domain-containing protein [Actinoplanes sandaracinus]